MNLTQILMTPSEVTNKILVCIFGFIEIFLYQVFFTELLKINISKKQKYIYVIAASIIAVVANLVLPNPISYLVNFVSFYIFLRVLFKQNIISTFIAMISTYVAIFVSAYVSEITARKLLNITSNDIVNIPLYHALTSMLIYIVFYIICIVMKYRRKSSFLLKPSLKFAVIYNSIFGIAVIFINSYIFSIYREILPPQLKLITMTSLLVYFFISMFSLIRTNKLEQTTQDLETQKIYNKTLSHLHDNIRCFKHDFNNIVQSIGGYVALNDMKGLEEYYKNLLEDCKQTNNLNILNPDTINNPSVYSLLTNKYFLASEKGIKMSFNVFADISNINFNIYEFTRILGILLDNAIEAAQETDEKLIDIEIKSDDKKILFVIENSCKDNNISTTKIYEKGYSTKENNTGIGLWKVHNILAKNTSIDLFTTVQNNRFKQQLAVFQSNNRY